MTYQSEIDAIERLEDLRGFVGTPKEFWPSYLETLTEIVRARVCVLVIKSGTGDSQWKKVAVYPTKGVPDKVSQLVLDNIDSTADDCVDSGYVLTSGTDASVANSRNFTLAARLRSDLADDICVAVCLLIDTRESAANESLARLRLVSDAPNNYQLSRLLEQTRKDVQQFSMVLDLMVLIDAETRYMACAMVFCNELASRFRCERVSLGWLKGNNIRLQVLSHSEKFDAKMDAVKRLEYVMEESLDQDEEIAWPVLADSTAIARDHEKYCREQSVPYLCSLPLRTEDGTVAVITCERSNEPFIETDVRYLRIYCDQVVRRLSDLKRYDRWFGARWFSTLKKNLGKLIGFEHTWVKLSAVLGCVLLAFLLFGKMSYRVEAPFVLNTDDIAYLPAPFEGFIGEVHKQIGDLAVSDEPLLLLDTKDLLLEEAAAMADHNRYVREMEKARADQQLSDMQIAAALAEQASIRLDLIRHRLSLAEIKAPFDGVIVEGDLRERIGSPVKQGDVLFKIAKLSDLYLDVDVGENDVHEIEIGMTGEIAFTSQPRLKFPIKSAQIEPAAQTKEGGNVFVVRCELLQTNEMWWRPGMSGIAKLDAGKRNVLWIFTHKTIDYLRMFFWW